MHKHLLAALLLGGATNMAAAVEAPSLAAPGVSDPILINPVGRQLPGIFVTFSPGASASCVVQATAGTVTGGTLSPAAQWQPVDPTGALSTITATTNAKLGAAASALRLNCPTLSAGSVTFGVAQ